MKIALAAVAAPAAALLLAAPALAGDPEAAKEEKVENAKEEKLEHTKEEKKICKRIAGDMSSRRRTKVCMTRDEWKEWNAQQRARRN